MGFLTGAEAAGPLQMFSLVSQIGGGIASATGAAGQASVQKINLGAQAAAADANARMAEISAQTELHDGQRRVAASTAQYGQLKSRQRAALGANGVALDVGSTAEVQQSTDVVRGLDQSQLEVNAMRAAFGQRTQAANFRSQASMARANAAGISPGTAAASSLLGSAGRVAQGWYQFGKGGAGAVTAPAGDPIGALYELNNGWD